MLRLIAFCFAAILSIQGSLPAVLADVISDPELQFSLEIPTDLVAIPIPQNTKRDVVYSY